MNPAIPLSMAAAAERVGMGERAFRSWATDDDFPFTVIRVGRTMKIPPAQIDFWLLLGRRATEAELLEFVQATT